MTAPARPKKKRGVTAWAGFAPLQKGRLHLLCPNCGRKMSNTQRGEHDPPTAEIAHVWCERCSAGCKEDFAVFLDAHGREVSNAR